MNNIKNSAMRGYRFEDFLVKLFNYYSIENIDREVRYHIDSHLNINFDFILNNEYIVEVKSYTREEFPISRLRDTTNQLRYLKAAYNEINTINSQQVKLLLIVANKIDFKNIPDEFKDINTLDISNILYLVKDNDPLREELISILDYSVQDILPQKTEIELFNVTPKSIANDNYISLLRQSLSSWKPKENNFSNYEKLCIDVLKLLFNNDLILWKLQQKSNDNLFRFDLICKIKSGEFDGFWNMTCDYFKTKYVIFEFKNYSNKITQKEIYTTEKYLYSKALRSVAIIISPNGEDEHSKKAIKGTLRENGKLILSLNNGDLIKMLDILESKEGQIPSDYLSEKLDELLINLEK